VEVRVIVTALVRAALRFLASCGAGAGVVDSELLEVEGATNVPGYLVSDKVNSKNNHQIHATPPIIAAASEEKE